MAPGPGRSSDRALQMPLNKKDLAAGAIFAVIGVLYGIESLTLNLGTALRMGPGAFPLLLSGVLVVLGVAIAVRGMSMPTAPFGAIPWRALVFILAAPVLFGLTVRGLGLVPAVALVVMLSSMGNGRVDARLAVVLAVGLAVFCWLVFSVALGIPLKPLGPWLGF